MNSICNYNYTIYVIIQYITINNYNSMHSTNIFVYFIYR